MKLKYMLRGLGIGVVVTAAIMGAYTRSAVSEAKAQARVAVLQEYGFGEEPTLVGEEETQSNDETESQTQETVPIIVRDEVIESEVESVIESAKAAEVGKSEVETESELKSESESESKSEPESTSEVKSKTSKKETESESKETESKESKSSSESEAESKSASVPDHIDASDVVVVPENIEISVVGGDDSGKVSRKLYNAGIVDSASEFDAFLMQHGYDKKISVGTKTININDTWQEIAEKLTSK
jgi:hypothetical protein